ncbi:MAG: hypothetical protein ICV63_07820 [Coleofasciculus sp. Co-bin14]|nr:hypothetical protein [Coleofasciculus sp. Co-bin14]
MDNPKCKMCGDETQWYGWIHGWLCVECDAEVVEAVEDEDTSECNQQHEEKNTWTKNWTFQPVRGSPQLQRSNRE